MNKNAIKSNLFKYSLGTLATLSLFSTVLTTSASANSFNFNNIKNEFNKDKNKVVASSKGEYAKLSKEIKGNKTLQKDLKAVKSNKNTQKEIKLAENKLNHMSPAEKAGFETALKQEEPSLKNKSKSWMNQFKKGYQQAIQKLLNIFHNFKNHKHM